MKNTFVTGGSGFVGSQIICDLKAIGSEVKALVRSEEAASKVTKLGASPIRCALTDESALKTAMQGCETVIHSAAHMEMFGPYEEFHRVNVAWTEMLLSAAKAAGVKRFVQIGAAPVVKKNGPVDMADETWPVQRVSYAPYLKTKSISDERVRAASTQYFACCVLRPPLIWGAGSHLLPKLAERVDSGKWRWLAGMNYPYSVAHVRNVSKAALLVAKSGVGGEAYNITDGVPVDLREFLTRLLLTQGVEPSNREMPFAPAIFVASIVDRIWSTFRIKNEPPISRLMVRLMGQSFTVNDQKIRKTLGFTNAVSTDEAMTDLKSKHNHAA